MMLPYEAGFEREEDTTQFFVLIPQLSLLSMFGLSKPAIEVLAKTPAVFLG